MFNVILYVGGMERKGTVKEIFMCKRNGERKREREKQMGKRKEK